jgi:hypothetical protein
MLAKRLSIPHCRHDFFNQSQNAHPSPLNTAHSVAVQPAPLPSPSKHDFSACPQTRAPVPRCRLGTACLQHCSSNLSHWLCMPKLLCAFFSHLTRGSSVARTKHTANSASELGTIHQLVCKQRIPLMSIVATSVMHMGSIMEMCLCRLAT